MSKRLQVLLSEETFKKIRKVSISKGGTVAEWVREVLDHAIEQTRPISPEKKLAKLLSYAKYNGPTGEIEEILAQIESGYTQS